MLIDSYPINFPFLFSSDLKTEEDWMNLKGPA